MAFSWRVIDGAACVFDNLAADIETHTFSALIHSQQVEGIGAFAVIDNLDTE